MDDHKKLAQELEHYSWETLGYHEMPNSLEKLSAVILWSCPTFENKKNCKKITTNIIDYLHQLEMDKFQTVLSGLASDSN